MGRERRGRRRRRKRGRLPTEERPRRWWGLEARWRAFALADLRCRCRGLGKSPRASPPPLAVAPWSTHDTECCVAATGNDPGVLSRTVSPLLNRWCGTTKSNGRKHDHMARKATDRGARSVGWWQAFSIPY
jgi:hypothetical protein